MFLFAWPRSLNIKSTWDPCFTYQYCSIIIEIYSYIFVAVVFFFISLCPNNGSCVISFAVLTKYSMCNLWYLWIIVKFYFIWIGLFIFRHIVRCDCWCANVRNSIRHATPIMPLIMTQIHSQEMSEVFQISYFDMETTFKSFVHVIFLSSFSLSRARGCLIPRNSQVFVTNVPTKVPLFWLYLYTLCFAIPETIRSTKLVGQHLVHLISCYYVLFDPRTEAFVIK